MLQDKARIRLICAHVMPGIPFAAFGYDCFITVVVHPPLQQNARYPYPCMHSPMAAVSRRKLTVHKRHDHIIPRYATTGQVSAAYIVLLGRRTLSTSRPRAPDKPNLRTLRRLCGRRNPLVFAPLLSRNVLPGVVNVYKSARESLDRILEGETLPKLEDYPIPVLVSAFDVTR